jgi:hypothetical protein
VSADAVDARAVVVVVGAWTLFGDDDPQPANAVASRQTAVPAASVVLGEGRTPGVSPTFGVDR